MAFFVRWCSVADANRTASQRSGVLQQQAGRGIVCGTGTNKVLAGAAEFFD